MQQSDRVSVLAIRLRATVKKTRFSSRCMGTPTVLAQLCPGGRQHMTAPVNEL